MTYAVSAKRWWLDRWVFVRYDCNRKTVSFNDSLLYRCPRLTLSWEQFENLSDIIIILHLLQSSSSLQQQRRRRWELGDGLWLEFRSNGSVRLQVYHRHHHQRQQSLYFHFTSTHWCKYINRIHFRIRQFHRQRRRQQQQQQDGQPRRQRQRRHNNDTFSPHRQRYVRYRFGSDNQSKRRLSSSDDNTDGNGDVHMQTIPRPTTNATRLSSVVGSKCTSVCQRQGTGDGSTFSFRRALNDHHAVHPPTPSTPAAAVISDNDIEKFGPLCSIE